MKRFDGWEPLTTTEYEYDDAGRLARAVTTREQEWDEHEQGWMLALAAYQAQVHGPCGSFLPDVTGAAADEQYVADTPVRCQVCTARMTAVKAYMEGRHAPHPEALMWPVKRKR